MARKDQSRWYQRQLGNSCSGKMPGIVKATKEWKEEVRTICCFNKMIETGLNIKNKSISYSSWEWEIQYASRFAGWPVLSHCSEAGILSAVCSYGRRGTRQNSLTDSFQPFYKGISWSWGKSSPIASQQSYYFLPLLPWGLGFNMDFEGIQICKPQHVWRKTDFWIHPLSYCVSPFVYLATIQDQNIQCWISGIPCHAFSFSLQASVSHLVVENRQKSWSHLPASLQST